MAHNNLILQNVLGSKAKVAALRGVVNNPGITARQVAEDSEMSWGAIRPAVEYLRESMVIRRETGSWSNGLFMNEDHVMCVAIINLFMAEKRILPAFTAVVTKKLQENDINLISILISEDSNSIFVVCEKVQTRHFATLCKSAGHLGIEVNFTSPESFDRDMGQFCDDMKVVLGTSPPFSPLNHGLRFFGF